MGSITTRDLMFSGPLRHYLINVYSPLLELNTFVP